MRNFFWAVLLLSTSACSSGKKSDLTKNTWLVDQAIYDTKDDFFQDTLLQKKITGGYEGREYTFSDDGTFSITSQGTTTTGTWTDGRKEDDKMTSDIANKMEMITLNNKDGFREMWIPWKNAKSIFVDYFGETRINVVLLPADESGNLMLTLVKK